MDRLTDIRRVYADLICAVGRVKDPRVVEAFATVPREHYLGPGPWRIRVIGDYVQTPSDDPAYLYQNFLYAIDPEHTLNNGEPAFLARLIDALKLQAGETAVHVGTGVGYYTAIMAELVGQTGCVAGFEVDPALAERSRKNLAPYRYVDIAAASGTELDRADVDALFINAGATHPLANWLDALAPGGRLVIPLTPDEGGGAVMKIMRTADGISASFVSPVWIYECAGAREPGAERRLAQALKKGGQREVRTLRRDCHRRDASCWLHGRGWCLSREPSDSPDGTG